MIIKFLTLIIVNIFLICSTILYLDILKYKKTEEKIVFGIIIYFFRILVFELLLGYVVQHLNYKTITVVALLEFAILSIGFAIKKKNIIKLLYEKIKIIIKKEYKIKITTNTGLIAILAIVFILMSIVSIFVYEYSYDGNYYHLPQIIDYIQQGKLGLNNNSLWNNVYPQNIELLSMFFMMFSYSTILARIPQIVFSIVGIVAVYSLLKELNFDKKISLSCALLYFVAPFVLAQMTTTYIDGVVATIFIVLLYILVKIFKENKLKYEIIYFITLSIFMGIKGTCCEYAVIITIGYIGFKIYNLINKKEKIGKVILKESVFLIIVILIGCTWMIQNIYYFQNPIHPFDFLNIDGMDANIDIGVENEPYCIKDKNKIKQLLISWAGLNSGYLGFDTGLKFTNLFQSYDNRIGGLGVQWMYFLIPNLILAAIFCVIKKYKITWLQLEIIGILIISFLITPANWWGRYVGFIILLGYIACGIVYEVLKNKKTYRIIIKTLIFIIFGLSIIFACKEPIQIFMYKNGYSQYTHDTYPIEFIRYIENSNKNIIVLEESYYKSTKAFVFLKGTHLQNVVNTYYIKEMYKNPKVVNHGIETYENFEKIVSETNNLDTIIVLDSDENKSNYQYTEQLYNTRNNEYTKVEFGEGIVVYEKNN